jgi:pilus assembly protein CpaF
MRPDRLVVGEVRGGEAFDMLQALNTGHDGSVSTVHANSPADALARLETLVLLGGVALPLAAVRGQLARAIDVIVQVARASGGRREIVEIAEVCAGRGSRALSVRSLFARRNGGLNAVAPPNRAPRRAGHDLEAEWLRCTPLSR